MSDTPKPFCPECADPVEAIDRRNFIRVLGGSAALAAAGTVLTTPGVARAIVPPGQVVSTVTRGPRPAEALIRELWASLSNDQRTSNICLPWNHGAGNNQIPTRQRMVNAPINRRIGEAFTPAQQDLCQRILRSIASNEDGYHQLTRGGTFDASGSFQGCGVNIFGTVADGQQWSWVFSGHHLTVRCDGNSEPGAAFGGPIYYGHSPDGYSQRNIFYYQTQSVASLFDALTEQQRQAAVIATNPGEGANSVRFRGAQDRIPGLAGSELTQQQRQLAESVMRTILSPYRTEDANEVMEIVRQNGGLERIHFGFFREPNAANNRWTFWRLEGPGFVWNYRVLPHVHTFVNIAARA